MMLFLFSMCSITPNINTKAFFSFHLIAQPFLTTTFSSLCPFQFVTPFLFTPWAFFPVGNWV